MKTAPICHFLSCANLILIILLPLLCNYCMYSTKTSIGSWKSAKSETSFMWKSLHWTRQQSTESRQTLCKTVPLNWSHFLIFCRMCTGGRYWYTVMIWQICIFGLQKVTRRADERWQRLQEGSLHSFCLCAKIVQTIYRWGGGGG